MPPTQPFTRPCCSGRTGACENEHIPTTSTSARRAGAPDPSTTEPPRIRSDHAMALLLDDRHGLHPVALLDAVDVLHAAGDLAEDRVVAVEVRRRPVADVELAARRVGMLAPRH